MSSSMNEVLAHELYSLLVPLAQEGFDLAIRHTAAPPDTHVAWALCGTRSWLVGSRAYLRRCPAPDSPRALAGHDCLHYLRPGDTPTWSFERVDGPRPGEEPRVTVPVRGRNEPQESQRSGTGWSAS